MNDELRVKLKAASDEADQINGQRLAAARADEEARRAAEREAEERHLNLCNTAQRLLSTWLDPLMRGFRTEISAVHFESQQGEPDGFIKTLPWKHCRLTGIDGVADDGLLVVVIRVESESTLKVSIESSVGGRSSFLLHRSFDLEGRQLSLTNAEQAKEWLLSTLIDAYKALRLAAPGVSRKVRVVTGRSI